MRIATKTAITITAMAAAFIPECLFVDELPPVLSAALDIPGGAGPDDQEFPSTLTKEISSHQKGLDKAANP